MNLSSRNLASDMQGDDVMQLHSELRRLGFSIPEEEVRRASFGAGTRQVVLAVQQAARLPQTGVVDAATAAAIGEAVTARVAITTPAKPAA